MVSKEILYSYYIEENHTVKECLDYFNITNHSFYKLLKEHNIRKPSVRDFIAAVSKESIIDYYITQDHSFADCLCYFSTTADIFRGALNKLDITKAKDQIQQRVSHRNNISKDALEAYYILDDHTQQQTLEHFNITQAELIILLNKYNLKKFNPPIFIKKSYQEVQSILTKDILKEEYLTKNLRIRDISKKYAVSIASINALIKDYDLEKPLDDITSLAKKSKLDRFKTLGNPALFNTYTKEFQDLYYDRDKAKIFLDKNPRYTATELARKFNCSRPAIFAWVSKLNLKNFILVEHSLCETEIVDFLRSICPGIKIIQHCRKLLSNNREVDIYLPEFNLAIEYNGVYWHSDSNISDRLYHFKKSVELQALGIRLIHIYEYEWLDPTKKHILECLLKLCLGKIPSKIYARNCEIREISNKEARLFNECNHLQGHRNAQITYGLFNNDNLVQLMSFSKTKYNKNLKTEESWEIIRGCPGSVNLVIGGVSKLFKHFVTMHNPKQIFSYCDFNKFNGKSYELLGMKFIGFTGPDKKYIIDGEVKNRNPHKYHVYKDKVQLTLYGAGSKKYIWEKE